MFYLSGHGNSQTSFDISPDGTHAISGGSDGTARIWNLKSGREVGLLCANREPVMVVKYSPQGDRILTGDIFGTVRIWDPVSESICGTLPGPGVQATCAAFSPVDETLLVGYDDCSIVLWDMASFSQIKCYALNEWDESYVDNGPPADYRARVVSCDLSPDGNYVFAIVDVDSIITSRMLNIRSGEEQQSHWPDAVHLCGSVFTLDGKALLTCDQDGIIQVANIRSETTVSQFNCANSLFKGQLYFGFSRCRRRIVVGTAGRGYPQVLDAASGERLPPLQDPMTQLGYFEHDPTSSKALVDVKGCGFSKDGTQILAMSVSDFQPGMRLWDIESSAVVARCEWSTASLTKIAISPDGSMLCALGGDMRVRLYELNLTLRSLKLNRLKLKFSHQLSDPLYQCGFSRTGRKFFVSTQSEIEILTIGGFLEKTIGRWSSPVVQAGITDFSDLTHFVTDQHLAIVDVNRGAILIDMRDEEHLSLSQPKPVPTDDANSAHECNDNKDDNQRQDVIVKWLPDSVRDKAVYLKSGGAICRLDISTTEIEATYDGNGTGLKDVTMSPDGQTVVCLTSFGELQLLDAASFTDATKISEDPYAAKIHLSPCGNYVLVTQSNGGMYVETLTAPHQKAKNPKSYGVADAKWHPSGEWVCTAGKDGVMRLWSFDPEDLEFRSGPYLSYACGNEQDQSNWASWTEDGQWTGSGPILLELIRTQKTKEHQPRQTAAETMHSMDMVTTRFVAQ